jgi:hypothetical protein
MGGLFRCQATDLTPQQKNGTFLIQGEDGIAERHDILPTYDAVNAGIGTLFEMPSNTALTNKENI